MITPSPTSPIEAHQARGVLEEVRAASGSKPATIVLSIPNTSYRIELRPTGEISTPVGKRLIGTIRAQARRIDVVQSGGKYIEPVFGHPRRVQGSVVSTDSSSNSITVHAGVPIVCAITDSRQQASQFEPGQFVSFDVLDGATFAPGV
jgi:hypothetical protein